MAAAKNIFTQKDLANGFVLLIFTDFEKCMETFKESTEMQKHVFRDFMDLGDIKDLPFDIAIIAPISSENLNKWNAASKENMFVTGYAMSVDESDLMKALPVKLKGGRVAFLFDKYGAKALGLN